MKAPTLVLEALPVKPLPPDSTPQPPGPHELDTEWPDPNAVLELRLSVINDSQSPIELAPPFDVAPELHASTGRLVEVTDVRAVEMPARVSMPPRSPVAPLMPGQSRRISSTRIVRTPSSYYYRWRYGGVALAPGRYTARFPRIGVYPLTRDDWITREAAFLAETTDTRSPEAARARATAEAAEFDRLWKLVPTYWRGELASNEAAFTLP